jgi:NAD(P)-dependent dehydrogenase (short-subunit alcohol dehydrogenase family)
MVGGLEIAISNVSTLSREHTGEEIWRQAFDSDFLQHVRMSDLALPQLVHGRSSSLIFSSSIASVLTILPPGESGYGAMKAVSLSPVSSPLDTATRAYA